MSIDNKLDKIVGAVERIDERTENLKEYIQAVSANQKATADKLDAHIQDNEKAHGMSVRENTSGHWVSWISFGLAALLGLEKLREVIAH